MNAEERKRQILEVAKRLFSRNGYYETQISDIVKAADIARGTVYQYFKNKDDIFTTLLDNFYRQWENAVSTGITGVSIKTIDPVDYFRHRVRMTLVFFESDREMCNIVLRMGHGLQRDFESIIRKMEKRIYTLIQGDLELGIRAGNVRKDLNVELTANLLDGALLHVAYHYFVHKKNEKAPVDIEKIAGEITAVFRDGIFTRQASAHAKPQRQ